MPTTPGDKGWPAYRTSSYVFRDEYKAKSVSPPRINCAPVITAILAIVVFSCRFVEYLFRALSKGFWELLFLLFIFHLPWTTFYFYLRRLLTSLKSSLQNPAATEEIVALKDSSVGTPTRILESGLQDSKFTGWEHFSHFQYQGEAEKYFRVRLWYRPVEDKQARFWQWVNLTGRYTILSTPPILTVCLAFWGLHHYGPREDVLATASLAIVYAIIGFLTLYIAYGTIPETRMPAIDLLIDPEVVTATDFLGFLERYLPQNNEGSTS